LGGAISALLKRTHLQDPKDPRPVEDPRKSVFREENPVNPRSVKKIRVNPRPRPNSRAHPR
jgi:hypothetical protein